MTPFKSNSTKADPLLKNVKHQVFNIYLTLRHSEEPFAGPTQMLTFTGKIAMQLKEATTLIEKADYGDLDPKHWADLGCGSGTFTQALGNLLPPGSSIYGVDTQPGFSDSLNNHGVTLIPVQADFMEDKLELKNLDGILMANSLHYVPDKLTLLHKLEAYMGLPKQFLIIEYDSDTAVYKWVPYPLSFTSMQSLFREAGYAYIRQVGHRPSIYSSAGMYAALVRKG